VHKEFRRSHEDLKWASDVEDLGVRSGKKDNGPGMVRGANGIFRCSHGTMLGLGINGSNDKRRSFSAIVTVETAGQKDARSHFAAENVPGVVDVAIYLILVH
jgi:site-specific DNA-cytosine methylase